MTPCVKAGTSERGCCPECGKPWERVVERKFESLNSVRPNMTGQDFMNGWKGTTNGHTHVTTLGWRPACSHGHERPIPPAELEADPSLIDDFEIEPYEPVPAVVLDPFCGSGTTGAVAKSLGRSFLGIDLNPEYLKLAERRIADAPSFAPALPLS